jgi:tetratricopeptide (TPR) repeat protein
MMRLWVLFALVLVFMVYPVRSAFDEGVMALSEGSYDKAIDHFLAEAKVTPDEAVYFNLGLAYEGQKNSIAALWAFEQALKYNPISNKSAANARLVFQQMNPDESWISPYGWSTKLFMFWSSSIWLILSIFFALVLAALVFVRFYPWKNDVVRKIAVISIPVVLILVVVCVVSLNQQAKHLNSYQFAYATNMEVELFIGKEGVLSTIKISPAERLEVLECENDWCSIRLKNGEIYWIQAEELLKY